MVAIYMYIIDSHVLRMESTMMPHLDVDRHVLLGFFHSKLRCPYDKNLLI